VDRPTEELRHRIDHRVDLMLESALIEEVAHLREAGLETNEPASRAIGYRETLAHLRGELPKADLAEAIRRNTWQLARKQRIWQRHQLPQAIPLDLSDAMADQVGRLEAARVTQGS
jgi:tRNA dimethylallyltransferase